MAKIKVEMQAFQKGVIRVVEIPAKEWRKAKETVNKLSLIFYWGQNDNQNVRDRCSVSVGDVILLRKERWEVRPTGFAKLKDGEKPKGYGF